MKYAHIEENTNRLLGWYDDETHKTVPTPNIEVADEVWQDAININANAYEDGKFIVKDFRTEEEIAEEYRKNINNAIQEHLDKKAKVLGYDNINSIAKYMIDGNPFFNEAKALSLWCANCWLKAKEIELAVENQEIEIPTIEEIINELPIFVGAN